MDLNDIITGCCRNKSGAQEQLYRLYKDVLFVLCLKYSRNAEEAEDNLHNAFIEIFTHISKYKNQGSFEGWMKRIAINTAIKAYKKKKDYKAIINDIPEDTDVDSAEMDIPADYLLEMIQQLPDQYRLVFNLYELDDYTHSEIAQMLSISEGTSKSNLHRAKQILKEKIRAIKVTHYR